MLRLRPVQMLWEPRERDCWFANWPLHMEGKEQQRKEVDRSKLGGGSLVSKGSYTWGLSWATARQVDLAPAHQNLKSLLRGLTWARSLIPFRGLSNTFLPQGRVLGAAPTVGTVGRACFPETGKGVRSPDCLGPARRSTRSPVLSVTASNRHRSCTFSATAFKLCFMVPYLPSPFSSQENSYQNVWSRFLSITCLRGSRLTLTAGSPSLPLHTESEVLYMEGH